MLPLGMWVPVRRCDTRARWLADRHYSRQTAGWGVVENLDPRGARREVRRATTHRGSYAVLEAPAP